MTVRDDLIAARALIDTPEKWVKGANHVTRNGRDCYCTAGAVWYGLKGWHTDEGYARAMKAEAALCAALEDGFEGIRFHNDAPETTHFDIMRLFDRAINAA